MLKSIIMELYSLLALLFVCFFLIIHELAGRFKSEYQWVVKLLASICFYVFLAKWRILFLGMSACCIWISAIGMDKITKKGKEERKNGDFTREEKKLLKKQTQKKKRVILFAAIGFNIGLLLAVRYIMPAVMGNLILPLGISFYSFMAVSYLVDVYGEKYEAEHNFAKIFLYMSWFPQMIQGPINRYDYVKDSLFGSTRATYEKLKAGTLLFIFGAIKKYAIANVLAPCVNEIFLRGDVSDIPGSYLLFTAFLYAIQQYADFSGGIDMVLGISGLFGVKMNDNFRQPYFSKSVAEFWRRWHISLGTFLRDYVFYPFAMLSKVMKLNDKISKRFGKHMGRSVVGGLGNLLVFFLVGLWHGSELHYILWGLYNGIIIAVSDFLSPVFDGMKKGLHIKEDSRLFSAFAMLRTFGIIVLAGYFDAVPNVGNGLVCFKNTFTRFGAREFMPCIRYMYDTGLMTDLGALSVIAGIVIVLVFSILKENKIDFITWLSERFIVLRWSVYYVFIFVILLGFASAGFLGGFMYAAF